MKHSSIFFLLVVFFSFTMFPEANSWPCTNLVNETCKNFSTDIHPKDPSILYNFCKNSLDTVPFSRCADLRHLGFIAINLLRYNTSTTQWRIRGLLLRKWSEKPCVEKGLKTCLDLYRENAGTLMEAIKEYRFGNFSDAITHVLGVVNSTTICEDSFRERGLGSPLSMQNQDAFRLGAIFISIARSQKSD